MVRARVKTHATVSMRAILKDEPVFRRTGDGSLANLSLRVEDDSQGWLDYDAVAFDQVVVAKCRGLKAGALVSVWGHLQSWKRKDRHGHAVKIQVDRLAVNGRKERSFPVSPQKEEEMNADGPLVRYVMLRIEDAEKLELQAAYTLIPENQRPLIPAAVKCMQKVVDRERRNTAKVVALR